MFSAADSLVVLEGRFFISSVCGSGEGFEDVVFRSIGSDVIMVGEEGEHCVEVAAENFWVVVEWQLLVVDFHF
jgi:hypothetical protein